MKLAKLILGVMASPIIIFSLPYYTSSSDYAEFNSFYYVAQLALVYSVLGLEVTAPRKNLRPASVMKFVVLSSALSALLVYTFIDSDRVFLVYISSVIAGITNIALGYYVFNGRISEYSLIAVLKIAGGLMLLPALYIYTKIDVVIIYVISITPGFMISALIMLKKPVRADQIPKKISLEALKDSLSIFAINSSVTSVFILDKLIATNYFSLSVSNSYIYTWGLAVPVIYIGNIVEKRMLSERVLNKRVAIVSGVFILIASSIYCISLVLVYEKIVPKTVDADLSLSMFKYISIALVVFSVVHFPVSAVYSKTFKTAEISRLAKANMALFLLLCVFSVFFLRANFNYIHVYLIIFVYLLLSVSIKLYFIYARQLYSRG